MYKVYLIKNLTENHYKIGYTRRRVEQRLKEFRTGNSSDLDVVAVFESQWGTKIEASLHRRYKWNKINGELFQLSEEDVEGFTVTCMRLHQNFSILNESNSYVRERGFK
jgi:hypothetical protein